MVRKVPSSRSQHYRTDVGISYELLRAPPPFLKKEVCHRRRACVVEIYRRRHAPKSHSQSV